MTNLQAALLGVIQGLTEFLPISSSAHLILAREVFGWELSRNELPFDVACHLGTLVAVLVYFRNDILAMVKALPKILQPSHNPDTHRVCMIAVGTLPILVLGFVFSDVIAQSLRNPSVVVVTLVLGGLAMWVVERLAVKFRHADSLTWLEALAIGVAQAAALVPGVSRSAATITVGMWLGFRRDQAARFGFLLGIPAILAAAAKTSLELEIADFTGDLVQVFIIGLLTSAIVGYIVVAFFLRYLARHSLDVFAYYRMVLAGLVVVWLLV